MKNPRIVLTAIAAVSKEFPQLRVGQLLSNSVAIYNQHTGTRYEYRNSGQPDFYYIEDELLAEMLYFYLSVMKTSGNFVCAHCGGEQGKHFLYCIKWGFGNEAEKRIQRTRGEVTEDG